MDQTLGILVSSDKHMDHLLGISRAAIKTGKKVMVFITNRGVLLTQEPGLAELTESAQVSVCQANFEAFGLKKSAPGVEGLNFTNQAAHGMLIQDCHRYIVL